MKLVDILKEYVKPSLGCTEPAAVALTAATAHQAIGGEVDRVQVIVDKNVFRNGLAVGLPVTGNYKGNLMAAALGAIGGDPALGLEVFKAITPQHLSKADALLAAGHVTLQVDKQRRELYIEARLNTSKGTARAITQGSHTAITYVEVNGTPLQLTSQPQKSEDSSPGVQTGDWLQSASVPEIIEAITETDEDAIAYTLQGIRMNEHAAQEGIRQAPGLAIGARLAHRAEQDKVTDNMYLRAQMIAAAAVDARMAGKQVQIMTSSGSGNQGITVTMPPLAVAQCLGLDEDERIAQSVALGHLLLARMTADIGLLTVFCGSALQAAAAASAAIVWLLGGNAAQVEQAASVVLGTQSSVLCDGAKGSCAIKVAAAADVAVRTALLSLEDLQVPPGNGLIGRTLFETTRNLAVIAKQGMRGTDECVLDILESNVA